MKFNLSILVIFISFFQLFGQKTRSLNNEQWLFQKNGEEFWLKSSVPGSVHTDLMSNNVIPDPYLDINNTKLEWVEKEDWTYKTSFDLSTEEQNYQNIQLKFNGLDTYADVYLNGKLILRANNMFRIWEVDAKSFLKTKNN